MITSGLIISLITNYILAQESGEVPANKENENIKFLDLSNQGITNLKDYDFSKYPLLEELDLSNNEIEHIPTEIFSEHKNLKKLNLAGNTKLKLPEYASLLTGNIEELNLSNCNIERLPYSIFDGLLHLKTLDLSNNPLQDEDVVQDPTLTNLVELQKITLPHFNKLLIQDICKYNNITVEIKTEDTTDSVHCTDIHLDTTSKENKKRQATSDEQNEEQQDDDNENRNDDETEPENTDDENKLTEDDQSPPETPEEHTENPEIEPKNLEHTETQLENTEDKAENANTEAPLENVAENTPTEKQPELENTEGETTVHIALEPGQPEADETTTNLNIAAPEQTNEEDNTTIKEDNEAAILPNEIAATTEPPIVPVDKSTIPENVPDAIDGRRKIVVENELSNGGAKEENQESNPEITTILPVPSPPPMVRFVKPSEPNTNTDNQKAIASQNTSEKKEEIKGNTDSAKTAQSTESSSTGTNVLIFLVVGVVIAGAAAFGYKFYKTRSYQATHTSEPIERELKEIVVEKKANGPNPNQKIVEEEPLMQKLENSVEIKEIDETKEAQSQDAQENIKQNDVPKTTNETTSDNLQNSGPYRPTTTTFKPPTNTKTDDTPK